MSFEAMEGHEAAFREEIQLLRPHPGQIAIAHRMRQLLARGHDQPRGVGRRSVHDSYSLRCIPQVLGPVRQALDHTRTTVEIEVNSVTDNPLCLTDTDEIVSAGNFHGHPLAQVCDYLKLAIASVGTFAERRIASLLDSRITGLPDLLTPKPEANSGFMLLQYVAASLASENKVLAHPSSVDSITTAAGAEDYNSMSATAARHLGQIVDNVLRIIAIEMVCAAQALDLREGRAWGRGPAAAHRSLREVVPFLESDDTILSEVVDRAEAMIRGGLAREVFDAIA
jgi:histidine ammonia-lyase